MRALRVALTVVGVAFAVGVLTSYGQQYLPHALHDVANSSTSWATVGFGLALLARRWWTAIVVVMATFVLQLAGYEAASQFRLGFGMAPTTWMFWLTLGAIAAPVLGPAAWWARRDPGVGRALGVAVLAGIAIGEGVYGLTVVAATTSPVWWSISIALGVTAVVGYGVLSRSPRLAALAFLGACAAATTYWWAYQLTGSYVVEV